MQNEILFESVGVRKVDERRRIEQVHGVEAQRGGEDIVAFERMGNCLGRTLGEKKRDFYWSFVVFQGETLQERAGSGRERSDNNDSKVGEDEKRVQRVPWKRMKYLLPVLSITVDIHFNHLQ